MFVTGLFCQRHCSHDSLTDVAFTYYPRCSVPLFSAVCTCVCVGVYVCLYMYVCVCVCACFCLCVCGVGKVRKLWWRLRNTNAQIVRYTFFSCERKTNRTILRLSLQRFSTITVALQLYQVKRMIRGIGNMLFSIFSQTWTWATSSGCFRWTCGAKW